MLASLDKNIKILESNKSTLKSKLAAHDKAKKDIAKLETMLSEIANVNIDNNNTINFNNIDSKLADISDNVKKLTTDEPDIETLIMLKKDILMCKYFLESENKVRVSISKDDGKLKDITERIKDNILITEIDSDKE